MNESKHPLESKTLWINGLMVAAALIGWLIETQTTGGLPFEVDAKWLLFIAGAVNFALRLTTDKPVSTDANKSIS